MQAVLVTLLGVLQCVLVQELCYWHLLQQGLRVELSGWQYPQHDCQPVRCVHQQLPVLLSID